MADVVITEDAREALELFCSAATVVAGICRLVGVGPLNAPGDGVANGTSLPHSPVCSPPVVITEVDGAFILPEEIG